MMLTKLTRTLWHCTCVILSLVVLLLLCVCCIWHFIVGVRMEKDKERSRTFDFNSDIGSIVMIPTAFMNLTTIHFYSL